MMISGTIQNARRVIPSRISGTKCFSRITSFSAPVVRFNSSSTQDQNTRSSDAIGFYKLFPKTFPKGSPPNSPFMVDLKKLRKEYRSLQQESHPDILHGSVQLQTNGNEEELKEEISSIINKAYSTLKSSLPRAQYLLKEKANIDLNSDDKIKEFQFKDKALLMYILEIHEELENVTDESELVSLKEQNDERITESEKRLEELFQAENYQDAALEAVKLKYWYNIANAIKNWEVGKPVNLTH